MIKIAVAGASGRMGLAIIREISRSDEFELVAALCGGGSEAMGKDAGRLAGIAAAGVRITDAIDADFDVMVDFSVPDAVKFHLDTCAARNAAIVIGTTGLNQSQNEYISAAANSIPVLFAANTSLGINLCVALVEIAAQALGDGFDIEIFEAHHRHKVDAPSATALLLGEAAANSAGRDFPDCGTFAREGYTGARRPGTIGFSTIRGGDIAGEHTVMFIGDSERIEITHRAADRKIFARGAVRAAGWISTREKGLFNMQDVLDLRA